MPDVMSEIPAGLFRLTIAAVGSMAIRNPLPGRLTKAERVGID